MPAAEVAGSLPIWSCSVCGLPCPLHYCRGGALLPHLFTLTSSRKMGRYILCGTFRRTGLNPASRTLSGTLLCGVRTFLSPHSKTWKATVRSSCQQDHYRGMYSAVASPRSYPKRGSHKKRLARAPSIGGVSTRNICRYRIGYSEAYSYVDSSDTPYLVIRDSLGFLPERASRGGRPCTAAPVLML